MIDESRQPGVSHFVFPHMENETGEIDRVGKHFNIECDDFVSEFKKRAREASLVELDEGLWSSLENTDSYAIAEGGWTSVNEYAGRYNKNWRALKAKVESATELDAPMIAKVGEVYHLVSGNTRLMVARAMGVRPQVLIVDLFDLVA